MQPGTELNHYRITGPLGAGGMGQVYRAEDTRLKRAVAIKVLPPELARDPDRLARLEREAQLLAQLEHPNVAAVYGLEESDGTRFLVMQLVEGRELAEILAEGPVAPASALTLALQIAEGLEAAHERGIVHRDLKPANVMVTPDGCARILDFGLARDAGPDAASSSPQLTASPTVLASTQAGMILGTAAYMSPEQARGSRVDRRADIWAFGCVLYEMLTARSTFVGDTVTDILAAIVHVDPDLDRLPPDTPPRVRRLLERCLEKDPRRRLRDIGEARITLEAALRGDDEPEGAAAVADGGLPGWTRLAWPVSVVLALVAGWLFSAGPAPMTEAPLRKLTLHSFEAVSVADRLPRLSPDGQRVVYYEDNGLHVRELDALESRALPNTAAATFPFWSDDGSEVGYFAEGRMWRASVTGGATSAITAVREVEGGWWRPDGTIVYGMDPDLGIVDARGGDPRLLVRAADVLERPGTLDLHHPSAIPGTEAILFRTHTSNRPGEIALWDGSQARILVSAAADGNELLDHPLYSATGHVLYSRSGSANNGVWAVPFSVAELAVTGEPFLVATDMTAMSVADDGSLLLVEGLADLTLDLVWVHRDGTVGEVAYAELAASPLGMSLSPDDSTVAMNLGGATSPAIWLVDERGGRLRATAEDQAVRDPAWTPDGTAIAYTLEAESGPEIWLREVDASGEARKLADGDNAAFSPDGRTLLYANPDGTRLMAVELTTGAEPRVLVTSSTRVTNPAVSPDGRWLAYLSLEAGTPEVHVRGYPDGEGRRAISNRGGLRPQWSADGTELYYLESGDLMSVSVGRLEFGAPERLLSPSMPELAGFVFSPTLDYGVAADGERFLLPRRAQTERPVSMILVQHWWREFADR